jgi:hypothetical protein
MGTPVGNALPPRSQQQGQAAPTPSLAQALSALRDLGPRRVLTFGKLLVDTHRPVTNGTPYRVNDSRRVSHGAMRLGHQTNHSDVDDHVSTIRLSRGQGQRVLVSILLMVLENSR